METFISIERSAPGARGRRGNLVVCPRCGGNVRRVRDIYGAYHQCLQCSREFSADELLAFHEVAMPPQREELLIA